MRRRDLTRLPVRHRTSATERASDSRNGFAMSKTPWLKFYPSDWQADHLLGTCSLAARGLWIELISIMHAAEPPGSLARTGVQLSVQQIAVLARCTAREAQKCLDELEAAGVFSRDEDGMIFSRRMRRDLDKAERDRANGRTGGNPRLNRNGPGNGGGGVNPSLNGPVKGQDKAQIPEARYQKDPSREHKASGEGGRASPRIRQVHPAPAPNPTAWDDDAPFGRDASGGAR